MTSLAKQKIIIAVAPVGTGISLPEKSPKLMRNWSRRSLI